MGKRWILILCFFSYIYSQTPLFTHAPIAKSAQGRTVPCPTTQQFNTMRIPQQCIKLKGSSKSLPPYLWPISRKGNYIKVTSDKQVSELIICKENCPQELKELLTDQEKKAFANNKIVRFYHKDQTSKIWQPIATIPEQQAHKILSKVVVCSDGSIQL